MLEKNIDKLRRQQECYMGNIDHKPYTRCQRAVQNSGTFTQLFAPHPRSRDRHSMVVLGDPGIQEADQTPSIFFNLTFVFLPDPKHLRAY